MQASKGRYGKRIPHTSIPQEIRSQLIQMQQNYSPDYFKHQCYSNLAKIYAIVVTMLLFLPPLFLIERDRWSREGIVAVLVVYSVVSAIIGAIFVRFFEIKYSDLKPHVFVTKLYIIHVESNVISFWPLIDLKSIRPTNYFRKGSYLRTEFKMAFSEATASLTIYGESDSKSMLQMIEANRKEYLARFSSGDSEYFLKNNTFSTVGDWRKITKPVLSIKFKSALYLAFLLISALIIFIRVIG